MDIDSKLARLRPVKTPEGDRVTPVSKGVPYTGKASMTADPDSTNALQKRNGDMRSHGTAQLEYGNDFGGNPQHQMEIRGYIQTVIDLGDVSGTVSIDLSEAAIYRARCTGATAFSVIPGTFPDPYGRTAWDINVVIQIRNVNASVISFAASMGGSVWAPRNAPQPVLNKAGYYEIAIGASYPRTADFPTRFYPIIVPA